MVAEHITNLASGKHSGKRLRTQMLVIHSAETPLANGYAASVTSNWLNRSDVGASINAFFGPDTTVRSVHTDYAAWHATWANSLSVGYEFTGYAAFTRAQWLTPLGQDMLDRAGRELAADAKYYGIPLVWLTTAQVNQVKAGNTTIKGLATHAQIDPANRTDPGSGFPFDVLMANIRHYSGLAPAPTPVPTPKPKENHMTEWTEAEKREVMVNIQNIRKDQMYIKAHIDDIRWATNRYLDTKISDVAEKVVNFKFKKLGLGKDEDGKLIQVDTSLGNELAWLNSNFNSARATTANEVKKAITAISSFFERKS